MSTNSAPPTLNLKPIASDSAVTTTHWWQRQPWRFLRSLLGYALVFLLIYTAINWWRQPVMPTNPNLQMTDYQGQNVDVAALSQNAPVLVYFWGTWCPVCKITSPTVNKLATASPYPVVSIAVQSDDKQTLAQFLHSNHLAFTTINDESGEIFKAWQGQVTPSYVIIEDGQMTQGLTGIQPLWSLRLRLWLASKL